MSLATLPLTTKIIAGLGLALALSLAGNVLQLRSAWVSHGEAKGEQARQKLASELAGFKEKATIETAIGSVARADNTALLSELSAIADRGRQTKTVYLRAAGKTPLALQCAPGQERIDAVNASLGPQEGK